MIHAHRAYDGVQDSKGVVPEDEPVFLLRASDPLAVEVVIIWAALATVREVHSVDKVETVALHASRMQKWLEALEDDRL